MLNSINPMHIAQKPLIISLFISLGLENIVSIEYCMSRIRISVKDPTLLAEDSVFLKYQAKGVIREGSSIHLIYSQKSLYLAWQLQLLLDTFHNESILELISSFQGINYINNITHSTTQIKIYFHHTPHLQKIPIEKLQKKYNCRIYDNIFEITTDKAEELVHQIEYTILYWDLIQSVFILKQIPISTIEEIYQMNYNLCFILNKPLSYDTEYWLTLGLTPESNRLNPLELIISNCSDELFDTLLKYYHFLKK
ncbi:MAG: PTS transporter subunit EIIB [Brevinema sp.]